MSAPGWTGSLLPRWFTDPAFRSLSASAWGLHCWSVLWCVMQESDGEIPPKALPFIASPMLSRREADDAANELVEADLWTLTADGGYQIGDWESTQPTRAEVADRREKWRREKRQQRSGPESGPVSVPDSATDPAEVPPGNGQGPAQKTALSNTQATEALKDTNSPRWVERSMKESYAPGQSDPWSEHGSAT